MWGEVPVSYCRAVRSTASVAFGAGVVSVSGVITFGSPVVVEVSDLPVTSLPGAPTPPLSVVGCCWMDCWRVAVEADSIDNPEVIEVSTPTTSPHPMSSSCMTTSSLLHTGGAGSVDDGDDGAVV